MSAVALGASSFVCFVRFGACVTRAHSPSLTHSRTHIRGHSGQLHGHGCAGRGGGQPISGLQHPRDGLDLDGRTEGDPLLPLDACACACVFVCVCACLCLCVRVRVRISFLVIHWQCCCDCYANARTRSMHVLRVWGVVHTQRTLVMATAALVKRVMVALVRISEQGLWRLMSAWLVAWGCDCEGRCGELDG